MANTDDAGDTRGNDDAVSVNESTRNETQTASADSGQPKSTSVDSDAAASDEPSSQADDVADDPSVKADDPAEAEELSPESPDQ